MPKVYRLEAETGNLSGPTPAPAPAPVAPASELRTTGVTLPADAGSFVAYAAPVRIDKDVQHGAGE
jgi:hypothetical protein